jgi:hypothetical protein
MYNFRILWQVFGYSGKSLGYSAKILDDLESFWMLCRVSSYSSKFLNRFRRTWKVSGYSGKFLDTLERLWKVWKVSGYSGKCLDRFKGAWNVSGYSGKSLETLESFHMLWKVLVNMESVWIDFRERGQFLDYLEMDALESFMILWKVSGYSTRFLDTLESLESVWIVSLESSWIVAGYSGSSLETCQSFICSGKC